jgi:hypothetical protein
MKKTLTLAVILTAAFLCPFLSYTQERIEPLCGTSASFSRTATLENEPDLSNISLANAHSLKTGNIPINFTIIRKTTCPDGDRYRLTVGILQNAVASINQYFPFDADFKVAKVKYVIDDAMSELPDASKSGAYIKDKPLYDKYAFKNGAIEVFIVTTPFSYAWCPEGIKWYPDNLPQQDWVDKYNFIALSEAKILGNNSVEMELAHELGHYFGLIHTHEKTEGYVYDAVNPMKNHLTNWHELQYDQGRGGDASTYLLHSRVKDTPADPNAKRCLPSGGCPATMECEIKDANSQFYKPDMFNIMGYYYSKDKCHGKGAFHFSPEQEKYMLLMYQYNASRKDIKNADANFVVTDFHAGEIKGQCGNPDVLGEDYKNLSVNILYPNQTIPNSYTTNDCGRYYGANNTYLPNQGVVVIKPNSDNSNYKFRVNMADVAEIARHVLRVKPLSNAYQMIAADVNQNGVITAHDVIQLYNLVNNKIQTLAPTPSWSFLSKYYEKDVPNFVNTNPFSKILKGNNYPN